MPDVLFLDMDGVLADFLGGASERHQRPLPYNLRSSMGVWNTEKLWGITDEAFWAPLQGRPFWEGLKKTSEADQIVRLVEDEFGTNNIALLTSPSDDAGCFLGKKTWIERNYPQFKKKIIFASSSTKRFMARPGAWLLDDKDSNVEEFESAGGHGILVPRLWNESWGTASRGETMKEVEEELMASRGKRG